MSTPDPLPPPGEPPPEPPRMSKKEWLWLLLLVLLVSTMIWLATSDVWERMFSVEESDETTQSKAL